MKEKILDEAAQLIQTYGLKKFRVDDIADELKISRKTIYQHFNSKDEIIREYFKVAIGSHKSSIAQTLKSEKDSIAKIREIVYVGHRYKLPVLVLDEAKKFYPDEWEKIEDLRQFETDAIKKLLEQGLHEGIVKPDIDFAVLSKMLEEISNMFIDYDFLVENRMKAREAIAKALHIIFNGVLQENK